MILKSWYKFFNPRFQALFSEYKVDFKPRYGHGLPPHKQLYKIINYHRESYLTHIKQMITYSDALSNIKETNSENDQIAPVWNNNFLPGLDIVAIYYMLAHFKPKKYIEVGSGNSTKVAYKAKIDNNLLTKIISIDPFPRSEIDALADEIIRKPFETLDYESILNLEAGDILFIDNSHRILPNSDAMVFFMEILPQLKHGVIVHIHDVYLPYDYPQDMCDRFYSEQYGLAFYLLANEQRFETILPTYFISQDQELSSALIPFWESLPVKNIEKHGGGYWLKINKENQ